MADQKRRDHGKKHDETLDDVLTRVDPNKRAFIKAIVAGAGFAAPTIASFSMKGVSTYEVHAQAQGGSNVTT